MLPKCRSITGAHDFQGRYDTDGLDEQAARKIADAMWFSFDAPSGQSLKTKRTYVADVCRRCGVRIDRASADTA